MLYAVLFIYMQCLVWVYLLIQTANTPFVSCFLTNQSFGSRVVISLTAWFHPFRISLSHGTKPRHAHVVSIFFRLKYQAFMTMPTGPFVGE
jgi:hypothetical protein